jgi:hypothetical protein
VALGLFQNIDSNRRKSYVLIFLAVVFLGVVGAFIWGAWLGRPFIGVGIAAGIGLVMSIFAWHWGASLVMLTAGAIVNPLRPRQQISSPFATHPPIKERIARLRRIAASDAESPDDQ